MTDLRGDVRLFAIGLGAALAAACVTLPARAEEKLAEHATCNRAEFRPIIDIGHTLESPGADSARGSTEYGFNFFLARQIERKLRAAGFSKTVVMITEGKARPSLAARIARANRIGGDLLLSIHHDSVPQKFKEDWKYEGREFEYSDRFRGHSIFVSRESYDLRASMLFGKLLGKELAQRGMKYTPHYTEKFMGPRQRPLLDALTGVYSYDKLLVLKMTHMPAVLLEAGNIVNRDEELDLLSEERQLKTSAAVTDAIDAFCIAQQGPKQTPVAQAIARLRHVGKSILRRKSSKSATLDVSAIKRR